jgi:hypothetical protein
MILFILKRDGIGEVKIFFIIEVMLTMLFIRVEVVKVVDREV